MSSLWPKILGAFCLQTLNICLVKGLCFWLKTPLGKAVMLSGIMQSITLVLIQSRYLAPGAYNEPLKSLEEGKSDASPARLSPTKIAASVFLIGLVFTIYRFCHAAELFVFADDTLKFELTTNFVYFFVLLWVTCTSTILSTALLLEEAQVLRVWWTERDSVSWWS